MTTNNEGKMLADMVRGRRKLSRKVKSIEEKIFDIRKVFVKAIDQCDTRTPEKLSYPNPSSLDKILNDLQETKEQIAEIGEKLNSF